MNAVVLIMLTLAFGQLGTNRSGGSPALVPRKGAAAAIDDETTVPPRRQRPATRLDADSDPGNVDESSATGANAGARSGLTDVEQMQPRIRAPEILAEALSDVTEGGLAGKGMTLQQ